MEELEEFTILKYNEAGIWLVEIQNWRHRARLWSQLPVGAELEQKELNRVEVFANHDLGVCESGSMRRGIIIEERDRWIWLVVWGRYERRLDIRVGRLRGVLYRLTTCQCPY